MRNAQAFSKYLIDEGFDILTGGTDNHMVLINLKNMGVDGGASEHVL